MRGDLEMGVTETVQRTSIWDPQGQSPPGDPEGSGRDTPRAQTPVDPLSPAGPQTPRRVLLPKGQGGPATR